MATIIPFRGLRYDTNIVGDLSAVTTPPYDIISPEQQEKLYRAHPFSAIRLELPKEEEGDNSEHNKYTRAADTLNEWIESGVLKFDEKESIYVYGQEFTLPDGRHLSYKGVLCLVKLEEFEKGIILPHEETLSKAKNDRFNLMSATGCNFSSIYSLYLDEERAIAPCIDAVSQTQPQVRFTATDGVVQKLWAVDDEETIKTIARGFEGKQLFIADGHHRYETALNFRNSMREKNPQASGDELYNYVMMFLVDMDEPGLVVFPTHRLIRDLPGFSETQVVDALVDMFDIEKISVENSASDEIMKKLEANCEDKVFAMYTGKEFYYLLRLKNMEFQREALPDKSEAYIDLDVSILHTLILDRVFGIDSENMRDQRNLVYTRDAKEAEQKVKDGDFQCAFFLNATKIKQIKDVSLANEKMPQKSTYFYPKLITGLIMNKFM